MVGRAQHDEAGLDSRVARLIEGQLRVMERQLEVMHARADGARLGRPLAVAVRPVPMLPNTSRYLTERHSPHPEHWNLGVLLTPTTRLDPNVTSRSVALVLERFEALRLRFRRTGEAWGSFIEPVGGAIPFAITDLTGHQDVSAAILERCTEVQQGLDLESGPMIQVELFELGDDEQRLLVVVHHFVMDQMSWPSLWEAFEAYYRGLEQGEVASLPPVETTFVEWAEALARYAGSDAIEAERRFWLDLPWPQVSPIPVDHPDGTNTNDSAETVSVTLTAAETAAYTQNTPGIARKADLITSALTVALARWSESDTVLLDLMCHGRRDDLIDGLDPLATVGFLVCYTPLVLTIPRSAPGEAASVLVPQIDALLANRLGFDLLRCMSDDPATREVFGRLPRAQVLFNYHGQRDEPDEVPRGSMFNAASESIGPTHAPDGIRYYPLAVTSEISRGHLHVDFVYSRNLHERSTIEMLADDFGRRLRQDIARAAP
jgi:non-ribosomal peptide synthase protein (TIGR01720 family)